MPRKRKAETEVNDEVPSKKAALGKQSKAANAKKAGKAKSTAKSKTAVKAKAAPKDKNTAKVSKGKEKATKVTKEPKVKKKAATNAKPAVNSAGKLNMKDLLKNGKWKDILAHEFEQPYFKALEETLQAEYAQGKEIFPPKELIFNALHLTPLDMIRLVILGQDPYYDNGQAMGLSFSVPKGKAVPGSLRNVYTKLERDPKISGFKRPDHGCLENWAKEGVLLLNAILTVEAHKANSHAKFGWQTFTDSIIKAVNDNCDHVVFILWGGLAHKKEKLIDTKKHVIIKTAHPSPMSLGKFKNCNCFSDCDDALVKFGLKRMNWSLS